MGYGFGRGMSCPGKLSTGRQVGGSTLLAEAILRRLTTPRGTLFWGPEESAYGIDLSAYVGAIGDAALAAALPGIIEAELLKDDRIARVDVGVTYSTVAGATTFLISISVRSASDVEMFGLTLAVTDVSVSVLGGMP